MANKPILVSAPMVRALIDGRKTQTRRIFKGIEQNPNGKWHIFNSSGGVFCDETDVSKEAVDYLRIQVGDRLWVREVWRCNGWAADVSTIFYRASEGDGYTAMCEQYPVADKKRMRVTSTWRPGIHMPRWASRLTLIVTDVRVERLQDISTEDAIAEGLIKMPFAPTLAVEMGCDWGFEGDTRHGSPVSAYAALWNHINGEGAWEANPFVAVYSFRVIKLNIDQIGGDA